MLRLSILLLAALSAVHATTYTVGVGKDETTGKKGKGFDPSEIYPTAGDVIVLEFRSGDHSVVESTFDAPCSPKDGGYNSGVITVEDSVEVDASGLPTMSLNVTGSDPVWFFDQAGGLCKDGAVLAINAGGGQTAPQFKANAAASTPAPITSSAASTSESASQTDNVGGASESGSSDGEGGGDGAIKATGGVVGVMLVAALAGLTIL